MTRSELSEVLIEAYNRKVSVMVNGQRAMVSHLYFSWCGHDCVYFVDNIKSEQVKNVSDPIIHDEEWT